MLRHVGKVLCALMLFALVASPASADLVIYNFNAPNFIAGQATPLLNRAPNIGPATFLTSFTSSPTSAGFVIDTFAPNPLFSGQMLFDPNFPADGLTLVFNTPVFQFQVAFALNAPFMGPFGQLTLTTPVGGTNQVASNVGPFFQGGTLSFSSATPFTTGQLLGFTATGAPNLFAIDNLTLNTEVIPEPTTVSLIGGGLAYLVARRRRQAAR